MVDFANEPLVWPCNPRSTWSADYEGCRESAEKVLGSTLHHWGLCLELRHSSQYGICIYAAAYIQGTHWTSVFSRHQSGKQVATPSENTSSKDQVDRTRSRPYTAKTSIPVHSLTQRGAIALPKKFQDLDYTKSKSGKASESAYMHVSASCTSHTCISCSIS